MSVNRINGHLFERMIKNGYANLLKHEEELNNLNVFPVADGDTGSNLRITLEKGIMNGSTDILLYEYLQDFNQGMLFGARGNSGAIFSQLFNGIYSHLNRCDSASVRDMRNAFIKGYKKAYLAVVTPKEGTILTVAREGIENIKDQLDRNTTMEQFFAMYISEMKKSLQTTPLLLPVLKEFNVVDSGAKGYIYVIEGMLMYLYGEVLSTDNLTINNQTEVNDNTNISFNNDSNVRNDSFDELSDFVEGYCLEFVLQLMKTEKYDTNFRLKSYVNVLKTYGDSIVCVMEGYRVKIHIHTKKPARVIAYSQEFGEFITFKLENMQIQYNEKKLKSSNLFVKNMNSALNHEYAIISIVDNEERDDLFLDMGSSYVINTEQFTDVLLESFTNVLTKIKEDKVIILANNEYLISTLNKSITIVKDKNIKVINTSNLAHGYLTLSYSEVYDDFERTFKEIEKSSKSITTITVDKSLDEIKQKGIWTSSINAKAISYSDDAYKIVLDSMKAIDSINLFETCVIFSSDMSLNERLKEMINKEYPTIEITFFPMLDGDSLWALALV